MRVLLHPPPTKLVPGLSYKTRGKAFDSNEGNGRCDTARGTFSRWMETQRGVKMERSGTLSLRSSSVLQSMSLWPRGRRWHWLITQTLMGFSTGKGKVGLILAHPPAAPCSICVAQDVCEGPAAEIKTRKNVTEMERCTSCYYDSSC